jgi:hypothetical protein
MSTPVYDYLQLVATALEHIRVANGYNTDLGAHVTLEPEQQQDDDGSRIVVLQTGFARSADPAMRNGGRRIDFNVIAQHPRSLNDAQLRLHRAQDDIERCLLNTDLLRTVFQAGSVDRPFPKFEESVMASQVEGMAWVGVAVRYSANLRITR